jgi:phosphoribosylformylglycinamidine synthase subunit PurS
MKARIKITLKSGVLDPQGKYIEVDLSESDREKAGALVERICTELLANTVIENYAYELLQ